jgi:hypothetical protein
VNFLKIALKISMATAGLALFPQAAVGDYFSAMERCVTEPTSAARMACVDAVTREEEAKRRQGSSRQQNSSSGGGGGGGGGGGRPQFPTNGSQRALEYSLRAKTRIEGSSNSYRPTMVFRCAHGEMFGYVMVGMAVQPDRVSHSAVYTDAIVQVDQERAFRMELRVSKNGSRLYLPSSIDFSNRVSGSERLTLQVTPHNADPTEMIFDIERFEKGIAPLKKACQW